MNGKQGLVLGLVLVCFFTLAGGIIYHSYEQSKDTFSAGVPPLDIENSLIPQQVDITKMHPPAPRPSDPVRFGSATSLASVIEFGDFECPACKDQNTILLQTLPQYHGAVRLIWRDLPITTENPDAMAAAIFARCAEVQGKFWQAHDLLFSYAELNEVTYSNIEQLLGLDVTQMDACRQDSSVQQAIQADVDAARNDGVNSAPFLFVGTTAHDSPVSAAELNAELKEFLASG
ncbi:MAG: thioredoxin domain-containing protein [Patescibacteria group bacterium]